MPYTGVPRLRLIMTSLFGGVIIVTDMGRDQYPTRTEFIAATVNCAFFILETSTGVLTGGSQYVVLRLSKKGFFNVSVNIVYTFRKIYVRRYLKFGYYLLRVHNEM